MLELLLVSLEQVNEVLLVLNLLGRIHLSFLGVVVIALRSGLLCGLVSLLWSTLLQEGVADFLRKFQRGDLMAQLSASSLWLHVDAEDDARLEGREGSHQ